MNDDMTKKTRGRGGDSIPQGEKIFIWERNGIYRKEYDDEWGLTKKILLVGALSPADGDYNTLRKCGEGREIGVAIKLLEIF